ncbi:MAG: translation initiation factor IF-2 [Holosporaceae bacterium]|jgi:translation initiation factor IF-2|nr:translation initiation factor IF-2 [Holosporaceae bacterium]
MEEQKKVTLSLSTSTVNIKAATVLSGKVRQSFSHGKSKVVAVEVKKKRVLGAARTFTQASPISELYKDKNLTSDELETRLKVVKEAIKESKEQELLRAQNAKNEQNAAQSQMEGVSDQQEFENESSAGETTSTNPSPRGAAVKSGGHHQKISPHRTFKHSRGTDLADDDDSSNKSIASKKAPEIKKDIKELKGRYVAGSGRISIYNALDEDSGKTRSLSSIRRARQKNKFVAQNPDEIKVIKDVVLPETISVQELSGRMAIRTSDVIKTLMKMGVMATANQIIDADTAELVILEFGHNVKRVSDSDVEIGLWKEDSAKDLQFRPPVVTIMGHVDHGKTSLLDALRRTNVALKEAGGITQSIGAYQVSMRDGRGITFIDTPGHAAFTEMRSRGANVTDVVVLVVAADDGVKDQTIEAINHAKAAKVPLVVAINKVDKQGVNPDRVRKELLAHEVVVEAYGGDVIDVEISAKTGLNLEKLEESILLQAEVLDLKANPDRAAEGIVIESKVEKGLGPVATVLIKKGTLKVGDVFVSGVIYGRVRAIRTEIREVIKELTPGMPGEIIGFNGSTVPGDDFIVVEDEGKAREISNYRDRKKREQSLVISSSRTANQLFSKFEADEKLRVLAVIIKADVQGSAEAICSSLQKLSTEEVAVRVLHSGIGEVTESDVVLARASNALILCFNVRANTQARDQISRDGIQIKYYSIIYDLIDDIKALLSGLLAPEIRENILGSVEVRKIFDVSKLGRIAGCMVTTGIIKRGAKARLMRDGVVIYSGDLKSIRRHKDDVKEVRENFECGITLENYNDIHVNDIIESFELEEVARQL